MKFFNCLIVKYAPVIKKNSFKEIFIHGLLLYTHMQTHACRTKQHNKDERHSSL